MTASAFVVLGSVPHSAAAADSARANTCAIRHFVFGYGSLICPDSRAVTAPSLVGARALPCTVRGLERGWIARIDVPLPRWGAVGNVPRRLDGWTAVGVRPSPSGTTSGVLIEVDEEELGRFDAREAGYDRVPVRLEDIFPVEGHEYEDGEDVDHAVFSARGRGEARCIGDGGDNEDGKNGESKVEEECKEESLKVWVYVQRDRTPASPTHPIKQSYVDVILRGCLSVSESFARSFIKTTHGWWHEGEDINLEGDKDENHHTWVEDRHFPLYIRADSGYSNEMGHCLDRLLREHHPDAVEKRRKY
eukprot:CAMPEP_0183309718 /NCGR_PEP_ID=MMETSP0160_2-20130417/25507_1 /TAXON_ID=2839 ORGANISM="Odontella Sinensis, Strain Grunow 1884" /NCGR_SAMPLE_ID=MMETSP0160_2 /ASSEMBLY_ACC=CAM_ASM_000250 /LENGTH=304 /DNA_ID=CAMNT_0025473787 /DNA_START=61 /DNA_END=975 /DNA_ORIENTATION=+